MLVASQLLDALFERSQGSAIANCSSDIAARRKAKPCGERVCLVVAGRIVKNAIAENPVRQAGVKSWKTCQSIKVVEQDVDTFDVIRREKVV